MKGKRLNDLQQSADGAYIYAEKSDGTQVKIPRSSASSMLGLKQAKDSAQMAEQHAAQASDDLSEARMLVQNIESLISEMQENPGTDATVLAKLALLAAEVNLLKEQMSYRPRTVWMSQAEFDRLTNDGEDLGAVSEYEDLRVYEPNEEYTPSGEDATYDETTMLVEVDGIYEEESMLVEIDGTYDEETGLVTL